MIKKIAIALLILLFIIVTPIGALSTNFKSPDITVQNSVGDIEVINFGEQSNTPKNPIYIYLQYSIFDPLQIKELQSLTISSQDEYNYYIIQFIGPLQSSWRAELQHQGVTIYGYIPDFAYLVKMDFETIIEIKDHPFIRWIGEYRPVYKISPRIWNYLELPAEVLVNNLGESELKLAITTFEDSISPNKFYQPVPISNLNYFINEIASQPDIQWLDIAPSYRIFNNNSAGVINATGIWQDYGLNGSGQIVTVCDTGLDTGSLATLHPDFQGKLLKTYDLGRFADWSDDNIHTPFPDLVPVGGHGTHVAGSVVGTGASSSGAIKGMANGAKLVFQSTMTTDGDLAIPPDLTDLFTPPYDDDNSRVHTNSWGDHTTSGDYTANSAEIDLFVWNNPDMVILSSAGNIEPGQIIRVTAPGTAKNCITVGASENNRPDLPLYGDECDDIDELASFSLPGPCNDGRLKPDIVAPGTGILSTRSTIVEDDHYEWGIPPIPLNGLYAYAGGTSMSTPITAGCTAIIRQYYLEQHSLAPSAALVKATLLNGAVDMLDASGTPPIPNLEEGWGRLNLSEAIFPNAPKNIRFEDNYTGLLTSEEFTYQFDVLDNSVPLKITLVWSDYPSLTSALINLVNDLNLNVTAPDGETSYKGNVFKNGFSSTNDNDANDNFDRNLDGYDDINNIECVYIQTPKIGRYTVRIDGYNIAHGPQPFAFAASGGVDLTAFLAPKELTLIEVPEGNALELSWVPCLSSDVVGYRIYRNASPSFGDADLITELNDNEIDTYQDQNLANGEKYYYSLKAYDIYAQTSEFSNIASGIPVDTLAPTLQIIYPADGAVFGGNITIDYINCSDTIEVDFSFYIDSNGDGQPNDGNSWQPIGKDTNFDDFTYWWNTTPKSKGGVGPGDAANVIMNATARDDAQNNCSVLVGNLTVDNTAPTAPDLYTITPNPTNRSTSMVAGKSEINATILLFLDDDKIAEGTANQVGLFNIDVTLNEGQNVITASAIDSAGNGPGARSTPQTVIRDSEPPVADGGGNRTVNEGTIVTFNGSGSYDTNPLPAYNYIAEYIWTFKLADDTPVILYDVDPTYYFDVIGNYTVTLRVADAAGNWGNDTFWIWVRDAAAPNANAGPDIETNEDSNVRFNGTRSTDNDPAFNHTANFTWTFEDYFYKNGSYELQPINLHGSIVDYKFYTPGKYTVTLTVTDSGGNFDTDTLQVKVLDITNPTANGGKDRTVLQGHTVVFDASDTIDNDPHFNTTASFEWNFVYDNVTIVLDGNNAKFRFNKTAPAPYEITLKAEDAAGNFDLDKIMISVIDDPLLPRVLMVNPLDGASDIPIDTEIWVLFNEALDTSTIFSSNTSGGNDTSGLLYEPITVYDIHNNKVNGNIEYDPGKFTLKFNPNPGQVNYNNGYTVTVASSITDMAGNPVDGNSNSFADPPPADDYTWVFATVSVITYPFDDEENIPVNASITATFSGNVTNLTIAYSQLTLVDAIGNQLAGNSYYDNKTQTVSFQPTQNLEKNKKYTAILTIYTFPIDLTYEEINGNISGKYISTNLTWDFYTGTQTPAKNGDDQDFGVMVLWLIYLIIIIIIIIVIILILKRSRQEKDVEAPQDLYIEEEDWSTEVASPTKPSRAKKKKDDVVEWDDDEVQEEDWKPPVMEWEEVDVETRTKPPKLTTRKRRKIPDGVKHITKKSKHPRKPQKKRKRTK